MMQNPNPQGFQNPPVKSSSGCGCFTGCLVGCFSFILLCVGALAFLYFTVDFKGLIKNKMTSPDMVSWIYKTAKSLDMVDKFLPQNLSEGEKLKIMDELDKVMVCYSQLPESDRKLILELTKPQNTQNLSVEQIQSLLQKVQKQCGLSFEQMQNLGGKLK
ncbi:MAG: hypothetical protein HQM15_03560 [Deltaproteobacteria bacterium]|nr:hypothetical protein [Deltaproteobacteria bacterium]